MEGSIKERIQQLNMILTQGPEFAQATISQGAVPIILDKLKKGTDEETNDFVAFLLSSLGIFGNYAPSKAEEFSIITKSLENITIQIKFIHGRDYLEELI
ncbi:MAG: hypothetical protein EZS28_021127 [Streblomastix strix]|uniref:Uncharacterized protein n=1 Tax=Streblomastix strix TaxID=222440 RepID=A0A5J4VL73_9EUKA|nr:MAG: hypothetical protein EZS28_021127 [Streblomastix strix]